MKKYVDFSGRARRTEYWMFVLFSILFAIVAIVLDNVLGLESEDTGYGLLYVLFALAIILPSWAVTVRRLHDIGKSGWWICVNLIPYADSLQLPLPGRYPPCAFRYLCDEQRWYRASPLDS